MSVRLCWATIVMIFAAACRTGVQARTAIPDAERGSFEFVADIYADTRMTGLLTVTPDTLMLKAEKGSCSVVEGQNNPGFLVYSCTLAGTAGLQLRLNRRSPVRNSTWTSQIPFRRTRDVCLFYADQGNGIKTCIKYVQEETYEYRRRSGDLKVMSR